MRSSTFVACGLLCWQIAAIAQTTNSVAALHDTLTSASDKTGVVGATSATNEPAYSPLTASDRWRLYFVGALGPEAILRAGAGAGISQLNGTPTEWRQGSEAYGDRFGSELAEHVIRKSMEAGGAALLHEDNRYFPSTDTPFGKRLKHAVFSVFVARNDAGQEHFAYSRFGSAVGASFISRIWQPPSETRAGDAADNFGLTMAVDIGWNVFREFRPKWLGRHF
ncbi:MAG TPA: hypothetical protein VFA33_13555 [Bryobacteraceae bacterium]|nr:hypothetical protein [Bryobacteraceae bacterium]